MHGQPNGLTKVDHCLPIDIIHEGIEHLCSVGKGHVPERRGGMIELGPP